MPVWSRLGRGLRFFEDAVLVLCLAAIIFVAVGQIVVRNLGGTGLSEGQAVLRHLVLWLAMLGAAVAARDDNHITVSILQTIAGRRVQTAARVLTDLFASAVCLTLVYASYGFLRDEMEAETLAFYGLPAWVSESVIPLAFGLIGLRYLILACVHARQAWTGHLPGHLAGPAAGKAE